jgi:hypothetical protein
MLFIFQRVMQYNYMINVRMIRNTIIDNTINNTTSLIRALLFDSTIFTLFIPITK